MSKTNQLNQKRGFSMLETIIAIGIIFIGLGSVMILISYSLATADSSRSRLIAAHLAQEGLEVVRNIRDSNWVDGKPTFQGIPNANNLHANFNTTQLSGTQGWPATLSFNGNFYVHSGSPNTPFSRRIEVDSVNDENGVNYRRVRVIVDWTGKGRSHQLVGEERLYDWRQ